MQATGAGGWVKVTPVDGYRAWIDDEDKIALFHTSKWNTIANNDTASSVLKHAIYEDQKASSTDGGTPVAGAWTAHDLNTEVLDTVGASIATNQVTLPAWYLTWFRPMPPLARRSINHASAGKSTTTSTAVTGMNLRGTDTGHTSVNLLGVFTATANEVFELQYHFATSVTNGLGETKTTGGEVERYAQVTLIDLTSLQGAVGSAGAQGATGDAGLAGLSYNFDTGTTTTSDGSVSDLRFNNASIASVTSIALDDQDAGAADVSAFVNAWGDSDSTIKGQLIIQEPSTPANVAIFDITGVTNSAGWTQVAVTYVSHNGSFANNDSINAAFHQDRR